MPKISYEADSNTLHIGEDSPCEPLPFPDEESVTDWDFVADLELPPAREIQVVLKYGGPLPAPDEYVPK
jgi:hypothetical protein